MKHKPVLTRDDVARILDHARAEAQANHWAVTIAIVDDGGHPLALERLDGAAPVSAYIATEKARTAAMGRRPSAAYEEMIQNTATTAAPWYVVPADNKWFTRVVVAAAVIDTLASLNLAYPEVGKDKLKELAASKRALLAKK